LPSPAFAIEDSNGDMMGMIVVVWFVPAISRRFSGESVSGGGRREKGRICSSIALPE
jgi:hypothetical protein